MKIAIIGYGRMGKEIEKIALEDGHQIVAKIDNEEDWNKCSGHLSDANVAVEFSIAQKAPDNILRCFDLNLPVVSGTTGWLNRLDEISDVCLAGKQSFFYAPNFSPGVNIFFAINRQLALLMKNFKEYDIAITEAHHVHKADAPSGTAIKLADDILAQMDHKKRWTDKISASHEEIPITSVREGSIPGTHSVIYDSRLDQIEITHTAKSRQGFAYGAIMAATWLQGRTGFFGMNDLLKSIGNK
jgi:4-hydroxy-tetrahydrodipicolinate reductase